MNAISAAVNDILTPGKRWGTRRVADAGGLFKMIAIDQRAVMTGPIAEKLGAGKSPFEDAVRIKSIITGHLAPHSTAMLLDPIYGYEKPIAVMPPDRGLMLAYEHAPVEHTPGGRKSIPIPGWSVPQIRRIGADAVKVLVWYRADASDDVRAHQEAFVEAAGKACAENDITLLLEPLVYPLPGEDPATLVPRRRQMVLDSIRPFCDPKFGVDIFKVEPPAPIFSVPDPNGPEAAAIQEGYDALAAMLPRPWVMLSAAAGPADFRRSLEYAYRAGASGYLAGRAIWADAFDRFPDYDALEKGVIDSIAYVKEINALTDRMATPWTKHRAFAGTGREAPPSTTFVEDYGKTFAAA
ncbi:MAG TPA: tagatose 1,6-diphosphate aldolase [Bauldia sp.]|nr:tagatose 1,6-diphosphate aldolase [Bauldia sp.]